MDEIDLSNYKLVKNTELSNHRFVKDIDVLASKPGYDLGTITFSIDDMFVSLKIIEGGAHDAISFRGIATDFNTSTVVNFHLTGNVVDMTRDLPYSPHDSGMNFKFVNPKINYLKDNKVETVSSISVEVIYLRVRSSGKPLDPDGALLKISIEGSSYYLNISGFKEGFELTTLLVVGGLLLAAGGLYVVHDLGVRAIDQMDKVDIKTKVNTPTGFSVDVEFSTSQGASTAPVSSGSP